MAVICIAVITLGTLISLISFVLSLKLSVSGALKNPFFISQVLSLAGLLGLIIYGSDFFDNNRHQLILNIAANVPNLLEAISKILWPFLGAILVFWIANHIFEILRNPQIYEGLAQSIFGERNGQNITQNTTPLQGTINSSKKNFPSEYQKEEYEKLQKELNQIPQDERIEKLLDFAVIKKILADFEAIFSAVFGTQLSALKALGQNVALDVHSFYDDYLIKQKSILPGQPAIAYENWEKFLINHVLVNKIGNTLQITSKGKDFLLFTANRYEKAL